MPRDSSRADAGFALRMKIAHRHSKLRDLNQSELAREFDVSASAMSTWFSGQRVPYENITELGRQFEVSVDWLLTGREPMRPYPPSPLISLAQDLMMLDQKTIGLLLFITRLLQKKVITHDQLKETVNVVAESTTHLSVD
jgi:transcriptional regulator with XRE-family HTH domain